MESFQWTRQFETGIGDIDEQHLRLVELINAFGDHLTGSADLDLAELETVFAELAAYADYHFKAEEAMMAESRLDERFQTLHVQQHADFLDEVQRLRQNMLKGDPEGAQRLLMYLIHWLAYHILGTDRSMASQLMAVHGGMSPERAYLDNTRRTADGAMDLLLGALNGLFHEVSERNRELVQLNASLERKVAERTQALQEANRQLEQLANTDALTGLPNRRQALYRLARAWQAAEQADAPLACLMLDADGFKQANDTHGHDAGDEVIRQLGWLLRDSLRTDDFVGRMGGDEFLVILPDTPLAGALLIAEQLREAGTRLRVPLGTAEWRGSLSIGVAVRAPGMPGYEALIKAADNGLYAAKRQGRNRVGQASGP